MDPVTAFVALQATSAVAGGLADSAGAMDDAARAESEARLADTQALQRDTIARDDLSRYLSTVRAARAANGLSANSPNAFLLEADAIETSDDERLRQRADDRQRAANYRAAAESARKRAKFSLFGGIVKAGIPLAQYKMYSS